MAQMAASSRDRWGMVLSLVARVEPPSNHRRRGGVKSVQTVSPSYFRPDASTTNNVTQCIAWCTEGGLATRAKQQRWLASVVRGHYAYYGLPSNHRALSAFYEEVKRLW